MTPANLSRVFVRMGAEVLLLAAVFSTCEQPSTRTGLGGPFDHLLSPPTGRFVHVSSYDTIGGNRDRLEIATGETAVLLDHPGPGVIRRLWIAVSSRDPHYLRRIALKMYWDGESEPSVLAPLGDFFGNGFDRRHFAAVPMGVSSGGFYAYLPMPFRRHARIVVENGTGRPIDAFYFNVDLVELEALPDDVATFHAWWNRSPRTTSSKPHSVLEVRGRGHFVGLSLNAESHTGGLGFLEGDEMFTVDGEFRGQGTGTEDYFNSGWYFDQGPFAAPYHGLVVKDDRLGRIAAYRWHIPDPIPFHKSLRVELEHGHANRDLADYATVAYWYQLEPHAPLPPLPGPSKRRVLEVKLPPEAILAESLVVERPLGTGGHFLVTVPVPRPDQYELQVYPMGGPGLGPMEVHVEGRSPQNLSREASEPRTPLQAVTLDTVTAMKPIRLVVTGPEELPVAAIIARPVRLWARQWMVAGPFPNPQLLGSETSVALDSVYGPELNPSLDVSYDNLSVPIRWRAVEASDDGKIQLNPLFPQNDWVAAYAQTFLYSPDARTATLLLGADDAHVLWLNGEIQSERQGRHISIPDDVVVSVRLRAGWNRVLLKIADLDGGWAFQLRVADPLEEFRWSARR